MDWYEEDVKAAIAERNKITYAPKTIFYGSSSIRLWDKLYEDFKDFQPVNLGFGGSTLAACVWFFDRIVAPVRMPRKFILYAGDNDLGDGRQPEEVLGIFREFMFKFRRHYPEIPFYFISVKPSISRLGIFNKIIYTNNLIKNEIEHRKGNEFFINIFDKMLAANGKPDASLFEQDGLHLNRNGYLVWREALLKECLSDEKMHQ